VTTGVEVIVRDLEDRIDEIQGLITLRASGEKIVAVVEEREHSDRVRKTLISAGVPPDILTLYSVRDYLIPYPNEDVRLMAWIEKSGSTPSRTEGQ
jgi:hypothetical protein